jgi:hypothetical protein
MALFYGMQCLITEILRICILIGAPSDNAVPIECIILGTEFWRKRIGRGGSHSVCLFQLRTRVLKQYMIPIEGLVRVYYLG